MFDAHCHINTGDCIYCTSEMLPQNYEESMFDSFLSSSSEIGLDRRFINRISLPDQGVILKRLLLKAKENGKPVTIHIVRCDGLALSILDSVRMPFKHVLWHGFSGSHETAVLLYKLGVITSIGPSYKGDIASVFKANPLSVLETDYEGTDLEQYDSILRQHYIKCAASLGVDTELLEVICRENAGVFKNTGCTGQRCC